MRLDRVINNPALAESFTTKRYTGQFVAGGYQSTPQTIADYGVISDPSGEELQQIPQGDEVIGAIMVHKTSVIYDTHSAGLSDIIVWHGLEYRVSKVWDYSNRGGYWSAICTRILGE